MKLGYIELIANMLQKLHNTQFVHYARYSVVFACSLFLRASHAETVSVSCLDLLCAIKWLFYST